MPGPDADAGARRRDLDRKINARSGGALLMWIGLALLVQAGWGVGLMGVGVILLVEQGVRRHLAVDFAWFWVGAGVVALGVGTAIASGLHGALVPLLLIIAGGLVVGSSFRGRG